MFEKIKRNPRIAWREYDDITVVITPDDRKVHTLNPTGTFLWFAIGEDGVSKRDLLVKMVNQFDAAEKQLSLDMEAFIGSLVKKGVLLEE